MHGLAVKVGRFPVEQRHEHGEVLAHMPGRLLEAVTVHVLDDDLMRQPDAEREAAAEGHVGRQRLLREDGRMAWIGRHDRGTEFDARHLAACHRQGGQRLQAEDVGYPGRRKAIVSPGADLIGESAERVRANWFCE